ncbi:glycosyltransferase [Caldimonas brevitalea]|uniref:Glycosyl transferase n=1 Tax=Caldimonas brevitalea TaxID=413882 RepID=A0A0G3BMZ3_9BURK|nr:glycosyltransferase [Caldimonas brevitalea]AKJ27915.1 glycosyl transferase [Caldimonas brevitalea]
MNSDAVLLVSHGFQSHYELGFANGLASNGVPVVLLGSDTTLASRLHPGVTLKNIRGSQDSRRPAWRKARDLVLYHLRLLREVWRHRHGTVMIIGMLRPEWFVGILEGLLLRLIARRLTLTVHNTLPHDRHTATMKVIYWLIYRIPHMLLVHTTSTAKALVEQFQVSADKILQVEHGLNDAVERLPLTKVQAKAAIGADPSRPAFIFFGYVSQFKGLELLLDALDIRPDYTLIVAGRCSPDEYGNNMRRRLEAMAARKQLVWFEGFVDEDIIAKAFAAADAAVLPYRHIDQSGVLLLALSLGVPAIATRVGGFLEVVNAHNGLFIKEATGPGVAEALDRFVQERDRYSSESVVQTVEHLAWRHSIRPLVQWLADGGRAPQEEMRGS